MVSAKKIFDKYFNGGKNFLTPSIVEYQKIKMDGEVLVVEISYGEGLFNSELFGVTCLVLNPKNDNVVRIDLSKSFGNLKDAKNYVKSITLEKFKNADRYGKVKII